MEFVYKFDIEDIKAMIERGITYDSLYLSNPKGGPTTLRQMPQNYCIAYLVEHEQVQRVGYGPASSWRCEPDLAADQFLCLMVFNLLLKYEYKYDTSGHKMMTYFKILLGHTQDLIGGTQV